MNYSLKEKKMKKTTKIINDNGYGKSRNDINKENTIIINKIKKKRKNKKIIIQEERNYV